MQRLKTLFNGKRSELWELVRYVVAGVLTTAVSIVISYGMYMLLSEDHTINGANAAQTAIGSAVAWVAAVLFAFWINRRMVFRVRYADWRGRMRAFLQFAAARVFSFLLFEQGLFQLLKHMGVGKHPKPPARAGAGDCIQLRRQQILDL